MRTNYWAKLEADQSYHVFNRSINKETIFRTDWHYNLFLKKWDEYLSPFLKTYAYCLIPDHFHFLVRVRPQSEAEPAIKEDKTVDAMRLLAGEIDYPHYLERIFKRLFSSYAHSYNLTHDRHGSLFQKRFKRILLRTEPYFLDKLWYVHHNSIHHKLVTRYEDWPHSSYSSYLTGLPVIPLHQKEILDLFHPDDPMAAKALFIEFHKEMREIR